MLSVFRQDFMLMVLAGAVITAVTCAYLGVFMILKRIVFMGIALSQAAALGVAIGLFLGADPLVSAFVLTLLAIALFWTPFDEKNISREALLGFVYAFCAAMAVIFIAMNPLAQAHGLNLIEGNLLYISSTELITLSLAALVVGATHLLFFKEFLFVAFDRETAFAAGVRADLFDLMLYLTIGIMISVSMRIAGVVFVFSSLVIPAMTALALMGSTAGIFLAAGIVAAAGVLTGLSFSYVWDLPAGPSVTGMYGVLFLVLTGAKALYGRLSAFVALRRSGGG